MRTRALEGKVNEGMLEDLLLCPDEEDDDLEEDEWDEDEDDEELEDDELDDSEEDFDE